MLVDEEMLAVGPEERAEATLALIGGGDHSLFEQAGEVRLGQVLRIVQVVALAADERVNRVPVRPAELGQGGGPRGDRGRSPR